MIFFSNTFRNGSAARDQSLDNSRSYQRNDRDDARDNTSMRNIQPSYDSNRDRGNFKVPEGRARRRRNSRDHRERSFDRHRNRSRTSREPSFERNRRSSTSEHENWREEKIRSRQNSEREEKARSRQNSEREGSKEPERRELDMRKGGIIVLPQKKAEVSTAMDRPR